MRRRRSSRGRGGSGCRDCLYECRRKPEKGAALSRGHLKGGFATLIVLKERAAARTIHLNGPPRTPPNLGGDFLMSSCSCFPGPPKELAALGFLLMSAGSCFPARSASRLSKKCPRSSAVPYLLMSAGSCFPARSASRLSKNACAAARFLMESPPRLG
jgi:hypothetical protein